MKMKKKVLTTSLAVSLAASSLASIPVYAAEVPSTPNVTTAINSLKAAFDKLGDSKTLILDAKAEIAKSSFDDASLVDPIFNAIQKKIAASDKKDYQYINNKQLLFELVKEFSSLSMDASRDTLNKIYSNKEYRAAINELLVLGNQPVLVSGDLEKAALVYNTVDGAVKSKIKELLGKASFSDLKTYKAQVQTTAKNAFNGLAGGNKFVDALKNVGITVADIDQSRVNIQNKLVQIDPKFSKLDEAIALAYLNTVTYNNNNNNSGGGGGGGGAWANTDPKGPDVKAAEAAVAKVTDTLADVLKDKSAGEAKASAAIQEALFQAAIVDLSAAVKTTDGKAVVTLDASKLGDIFKTLKALADTANKVLKAAAPNAAPVKPVAVLDLGTVNAKKVEFPLAKEVLAAAKTNGIELLGLKVNGVVLAADLDQLGAAATVNINQLEKSALPSASLKSASEVYEFSFNVDGSAKGTFAKPIEVRLPVAISGLDQELLAFTKIDGNNLIFKGGKYDTNKKTFLVANKSFSSYAVLENKVSFTDIAGVKDWAGRQISVAAAKGIIDGRAEGQFVPNASVTRAEFAKLVVTALGLESATAKESFTDVDAKSWYQPYVAAAAEAGLINGRAEGIFAPEATITRAELATIAARALEKVKSYKPVAETDTALAVFKDAADVHATLKSGVAFATEQGLVVGQDEALFNPNASTTRAEAAVVIYRLFNK